MTPKQRRGLDGLATPRRASTHRAVQRVAAQAGAQVLELLSDRGFPRHAHDEFGIGIVHDGAQRSWSDLGMVEAVAGDVITVNPGELHDGLPIGGQPRHWSIVYLSSEALVRSGGVDAAAYAFARPVLRTPGLAGQVLRLIARLAEAKPGDEMDDHGLAVDEAMVAMLMTASAGRLEPGLDAGPVTSALSPRRAPAPVARARARLDDDPATPVSLAELAASAGVSRFAFLRAFRKQVGTTPHAYRLQAQARLARRLLLGGMAAAEVAACAGFADQSHLTRVFARQFGMTPGRVLRA